MSEIRNYFVANPIVALGKIEDSIVERLRRHKQRITFCENKKAKYDDNVPFDFPFFNERQMKTTQKTFFTDCQLSNNKITFGLRQQT